MKRWRAEHDRLSDTIFKTKIRLGLFGEKAEIERRAKEMLALEEEMPKNYTILKTNLDYLREAETMKHCIHTYIESAMEGNYIAISIITDENRYTLGLKMFKAKGVNGVKWKIDQIRGIRNMLPSEKEREAIRTTLTGVKSISVI